MYATCSKNAYDDLPNLNIFIDNNHFVLPKESYIHREFGFCYLLVIAKDFRPGRMFGRNMWILGNNFLTNYYSIYDLENQRIGLVESRHAEFISARSRVPEGRKDYESMKLSQVYNIIVITILALCISIYLR